jgi:hypothetical protein
LRAFADYWQDVRLRENGFGRVEATFQAEDHEPRRLQYLRRGSWQNRICQAPASLEWASRRMPHMVCPGKDLGGGGLPRKEAPSTGLYKGFLPMARAVEDLEPEGALTRMGSVP